MRGADAGSTVSDQRSFKKKREQRKWQWNFTKEIIPKNLTPKQKYPNYKDLSNACHNEWKRMMGEHITKKFQNTRDTDDY